ncbi:MAG: PhoH family protein [Fibrobacteria bacterium]|nr:PhoH family protein [Fibrobacteria bacterium]
MADARKIFVLDTSVVIHDPHSIYTFGDNDVVIPLAVISEIDMFKGGDDQKAFNAREFSRTLDRLKEEHETLLEFAPLPEPATGGICISGALDYVRKVPAEFDQARKDREIIATALRWAKENPDRPVILVSKDTNVRLMGHATGLVTEDYKRGRIQDVDLLSQNTVSFSTDDANVDRLMREGSLPVSELGPEGERLRENACLTLLGNGDSHARSALAVVERNAEGLVLKRLLRDESRLWSLVPRNREQIFAATLLRNPSVRLVTLVGKAGTGKTLLAMAAGLDQVLEPKRRQYRKIVVMRPLVSVGKEMGWLPGDVNEKIHPWMKPIFDNVQLLLGDEKKEKGGESHGHHQFRLQQLLEQGIIELEAMSFVRGRSINDAFIVIDEAQNLTPHEMKTLMTRAAGRSKVVLTGDLQQIDTPYLDAHSSGLTHVVKKFRDQPIAGHCTLTKGERSELAELAADLL